MPRLRKTLPRGIADLLARGTVDAVLAELDHCEVGARTRSRSRESALHFAPCPDEVVRWLVARGEDVNAADLHGFRPLHTRCTPRSWHQIPLLLSLGADVDAPALDGRTALHVAAEHLCREAVDALLEGGADPCRTVTTTSGRIHGAIAFALRNGRHCSAPDMVDIVERLVRAGARPTGDEGAVLASLEQRRARLAAHQRHSADRQTLTAEDRALTRLHEIVGHEAGGVAQV